MSTRDINLRYGNEFRSLSIDERNLLAVVEPKTISVQEPEPIISKSLDNPIGSPCLNKMVHRGDKVTILIDDNTRPTPVHLLLPPLLERLLSTKVNKQDITILIAGGTHCIMTKEEISNKVGDNILKNYRVFSHRWMDKDALVILGQTSMGVPVAVNRLVAEADFCIGIGNIAPHPLAGWSGGGKIVEPGVCGESTTGAVHIRLAHYLQSSFLGMEDCPIRLEIERVARKAGLRFILNTVLDAEHNIVEVFTGDPVAAHRAGVEFARSIWCAPIPELADIVIASSYPADIDFWQAEKSLSFMEQAVKRGGDMILLAPCLEGLSQEENHRDMILKYSRYPSKEILAKAKSDGAWDMAGVNVAVHMAMKREFANVTIVSYGISQSDCEVMGFYHSTDINKVFQAALKQNGPDAKVIVLTQGPKVIPVWGQEKE